MENSYNFFTLKDIQFQSFRNYQSLSLELSPGFNILYGANAQGKTNVLEGLYLLSTTKVLRGSKPTEAIQNGSHFTLVKGNLLETITELSIKIEKGLKKQAKINGSNLPKASELLGRLPSVCITSSDTAIVRGEPSVRRSFLDLQISQLDPAYLKHLTYYKRALEQRNNLIRKKNQGHFVSDDEFEIWEEQLGCHGASIRQIRMRFIQNLCLSGRKIQEVFHSCEELGLNYLAKDDSTDSEELTRLYSKKRHEDILRNTTTVGPQRDDLEILINNESARLFGSQGQQRSVAISMKLAVLSLVTEKLGSAPLLLLDDIFSDLDNQRREKLVKHVTEHAGQVLLTCTELEQAGRELSDQSKILFVENGVITVQ